jgi:hypothetical protein
MRFVHIRFVNRSDDWRFAVGSGANHEALEIDGTLREIRVTPIKTLGQNFLHDGNLAVGLSRNWNSRG